MTRFACLAVFLLAFFGPGHAHAQDDKEALAGLYDGSQTEVAAALELAPEGRYRYRLSYGALDEWSVGTWTQVDGAVVLHSDPFTAPEFASSTSANPSGKLSVKLVLPDGFDPQYFAMNVYRKDGSASIVDLASGSLDLAMGDNPVVSVRPVLPVMDLLGPAFSVLDGGADMTIAFKPNDLGFVGFSREAMTRNGDGFELQRHGVTLRFRRVQDAP